MSNTQKIGWIGAGRMGYQMVERLAKANHDVSVWNRTKAKAQPLSKDGAKIVDKLSDLTDVDILFAIVSEGKDLEEVYFGNNGAARFHDRSMTEGGTWRVLPNGQVCSRMPHIAGGAENCYVLSRYGDVILYGPPNGPARGSIRVVSGNPQAL